MLDAFSPSETDVAPTLQRAHGRLRIAVRRRGDETVLDDFYQEGCLKARLPRGDAGAWRGIVALNNSGGIAAGDDLASEYRIGAGAALSLASQAAERCYRALPGAAPARVRNRIMLEAGASAEWLAQETILYDRAALDRKLEIEMPGDGHFLGIEMLVMGRAAMGETVRDLRLRDTISLRCDGRLVLHDAIRLDPALHGPADRCLSGPATAGGARASATLIFRAPTAEALLDPLRAALADAEAGASAWNGLLLARILAPDGASLRRAVLPALAALRAGRPLPRVWLC